MLTDNVQFNAPIPGESLTAELGGRPWQTPSKLTNVDEAIDYYMERMSSEDFMEQVVDILESGVPVATVANTLQLASVMDGIHTVDVGSLVVPVIMEMMMLLADSADIEYKTGLEEEKEEITDSKIAKAVSQYKNTVKNNDIAKPKEVETKEEPEVEDEPAGLMARRK